MSDTFDAYYVWLGIPPEEQPPNLYRLLGLRLFENNPEVIEEAAIQRMAHVRTFQLGPHAQTTQKLLNEIASARICLLTPEKKAAYDSQLCRLAGYATTTSIADEPLGLQTPILMPTTGNPPADQTAPEISRSSRQFARGQRSSLKAILKALMIVTGSLFGLLLVAIVLRYGNGGRPLRLAENSSFTRSRTQAAKSGQVKVSGENHPYEDNATLSDGEQHKTPSAVGAYAGTASGMVNTEPSLREDYGPRASTETPPKSDEARATEAPPNELNGENAVDGVTPSGDLVPHISDEKSSNGGSPEMERSEKESRPSGGRMRIPSRDEVDKALVEIRQVFADKYVEKDLERKALAEMLAAIAADEPNPFKQFALLREAFTIAVELGDVGLALKTVNDTAQRFEVDQWQMTAAALEQCVNAPRPLSSRSSLEDQVVRRAIDASRDAAADDNLRMADRLADLAVVAAGGRGKGLQQMAASWKRFIQEKRLLWEQAEKAKHAVATEPENAEANLALGVYRAAAKEDWTAALPHFVLSGIDEIVEAAKSELAGELKPAEQVHVANLWLSAAEVVENPLRPAFLRRAYFWYETVLPHLQGLEEVQAGNQLLTLHEALLTDHRIGVIRRWQGATNEADQFWTVAFSPDGHKIAAGANDGKVRIWSVNTGRELQCLPCSRHRINAVAFTPDGKVLATGDLVGILQLWSLESGKLLWETRAHGERIREVAFSPSGQRLLSSAHDHLVKYWRVAEKQCVYEFRQSLAWCVAFGTTGPWVLTGGGDHLIRQWSLTNGTPMRVLKGHDDAVVDVDLSPEDRLLASASSDRSIRLWSFQQGREIAKLLGHTDHVWGVDFSPDGRRLLSCSVDGTVRLWDVPTRQEILRFDEAGFYRVQFSPDGQRAVSSRFNEVVLIGLP